MVVIIAALTLSIGDYVTPPSLPLNRSEEQRVLSLVKIFSDYIRLHSIHTLRKESAHDPRSFCARKFVSGLQMGCQNLGNAAFQYLNGFLYSVILNRTLVVADDIECENATIINRPWIATFSDIQSLFHETKCDESRVRDLEMFHLLPQFYNSSYVVGTSFDYSCYLDRVDLPILSFSQSEFVPYRVFYNQTILVLGEIAKAKVQTLFSNYIDNDGYFESMGFALHYTVEFSPEVYRVVHSMLPSLFPGISRQTNEFLDLNHTPVHRTVAGDVHYGMNFASSDKHVKGFRRLCMSYPPNTITIAMHIRHFDERSRSNSSLDEELDQSFSLRLKEVLNEKFKGLRCRLLLASDRKESFQRLRTDAVAMGCEVYYLPRGNLSIEDNVTECLMGNEWQRLCLEQGPWRKGLLQVADLLLLSYAQYFIGTGGSTYSYTIAQLVSLRRAACFRNWMPSPIDFVSGRQGWLDFGFRLHFPDRLTVPCPPEAVKRLSQSVG